ncbi:hypothetical protein CLU96_2386 [Chryseobacterium sp. 52]|nr:hypothetical protein [Chryseobacterium sp. 52]PIF45382.1 hypothetical protein CLU96_2386 [Chryseobacterium sp. 52]
MLHLKLPEVSDFGQPVIIEGAILILSQIINIKSQNREIQTN